MASRRIEGGGRERRARAFRRTARDFRHAVIEQDAARRNLASWAAERSAAEADVVGALRGLGVPPGEALRVGDLVVWRAAGEDGPEALGFAFLHHRGGF